MQRTVATLTKQTRVGLSTWSFVVCDGVHIAFGGTSNRCRTFRNMQQMSECIRNFEFRYGYQSSVKTVARPVRKLKPESLMHEGLLTEDLKADLWALQPSAASKSEVVVQDEVPVAVQIPLFA